MSKDKLGRKILDLIEENRVHLNENEEIVEIGLEKIKPNPNQPRKRFDPDQLQELASSIKSHGVMQPIIVKPEFDGYTIVSGERRVRASIMANKDKVPAIIREYNDILLAELAVIENLQREDLNPVEEAIAYKNIIENLNITQLDLAKKIGKSRPHVTNSLRLLKLPVVILEMISNSEISLGHAKVLQKVKSEKRMIALANKVINQDLSVRKLEKLVATKPSRVIENIPESDKTKAVLEEKLKGLLGKDITVILTKNEIRVKFQSMSKLLSSLSKKNGESND